MSAYISEKDLSYLQQEEQELSEISRRILEDIQIEIKNVINNYTYNSNNPNKVISALQQIESLSNTCNNDVRKYQEVCKELINAEKEKCQNEVNFIKQQQNDTDNSLERKILSNYITNRDLNRKSYWKSFQYLANSDSIFVNKSPRNITAAELLVTNVDSFQKQEIRMQEQITKLLNEIAKIKTERDGMTDSFEILNSKLQAILIQKEDAEEETNIVKQKLNDFKKSYDDKLYEYKELENQLQDERTRCANLEQQCQELTQQIDDQHDVVVSNLNEQVRDLTEQCQQYEKEKRKMTLDYELSVQNYNSLVEKTDQDISYKNKELASVTNQLKSESELVEKLTNENKKLLIEIEEKRKADGEFNSIKDDYDKINNELSALNVDYLEVKKENEKLKDTNMKNEGHITNLKNYLNEITEKNEALEAKLNEVLSKWNEERNKLIAKSTIDRHASLIDVNTGDSSINRQDDLKNTVYYNNENELVIEEINLINSFESSDTKKDMLNEIEKYKEEINSSKNLYMETDNKYKESIKKLEKTEQSLHKMEEANSKLEKKIDHVKQVYSSMLEAVQTQSRMKIENLSEKLDYTNECLEDTKKKNSALEANLKENATDELNRILSRKEEEIENLRNELQQSVSETNRNDFLNRENQLKEKIRELEGAISSNEISWNKQNEELNALNERNAELQRAMDDTKLLLESKEEQEEEKIQRIESLEKSLEEAKKSLEEKVKELSQNNYEVTDMQSQNQHFSDRVKELSNKLEESNQLVDHLREENKTCQMDLLHKEEEMKTLQQKIENYEKNNKNNNNNNINSNYLITNEPESISPDEAKTTRNNSVNSTASMNSIKKIAMVDRELSRKLSHANHEQIVESLSNQIFKLYNEMDNIETEKINLQEEYEALEKEKNENESNLNKELKEIREELQNNKESLITLRKKYETIEQETTNCKTENESLKRELERYQLKLENTNKKMLAMMEEHEEALKQKDEKYDELYKLNSQLRDKYNRFINLLKQKGVL